MDIITNEKFVYDWGVPILHCNNITLIRSFAMSTAIVTTPATHGYLDTVGRVAMSFARKMLAFAPFAAATSHTSAAHVSLLSDREAILRLARTFDATSPSQAAELRNLVGRD
jgi:hypothetical protein